MPERQPTATGSIAEPAAGRRSARPGDAAAEHGVGWLVFAGVMLTTIGALNVIYGIAAISGSRVFPADTRYLLGDLTTFGWLLVVLGAVQVVAALAVLAWAEWARWVGIVTALANSIVQLLVMPAQPFVALSLFAVDILVIYGLVAYGGHRRAAA